MGFGRKKKQDAPPPADDADASAQAAAAAVLVESKIEMTSFSKGSVDVSQFSLPAGYKQVEARQID